MRVLIVIRSLEVGGLEIMALELASSLRRINVVADICCVEREGDLAGRAREAGVPVVSLDKGPGFSPRAMLKLAGVVANGRYDVVHSHNPPAHIYGAVAGFVRRKPVIHTVHQIVDRQPFRRSILARVAARLTTQMVAVSAAAKSASEASFKLAPDHIDIVENGLDLAPYLALPIGSSAATGPLIGTIGRLAEVKNQQLLLRACALLRKENKRLSVRLIGDGELRQELESLAAELGLADGAEFRGYRQDVPGELAPLDLFVLSSRSEGMPLVIIEAMAAGKAIVATRVGGLPNMIEDGVTGILVAPGDPDALANALKELINRPETAARLGRAAREFARANYGSGKMAEEYLRLYREHLRPD